MNDTLEEDIMQLKKEIWSIAKKTIPAIRESIAILQPGGSTEHLQAAITANANKIANCQAQLSAAANTIAACQEDLKTATASIQTLQEADTQTTKSIEKLNSDLTTGLLSKQQQIASLSRDYFRLEEDMKELQSALTETSTNLANLTRTVENLPKPEGVDSITLLYDKKSTDPAINMGKPGGWQTGEFIDFDFTKYKRLRFYGRLYNVDGFCDYDLVNRESILMTMFVPFVGGNGFRGLTASVLQNKLSIALQYGFTYTWDVNLQTFKFERVRNQPTYYIYRIEGVS